MSKLHIDICICTYQRESVRDTMLSLEQQDIPQDMDLRVIVIDNDARPSAQARVEDTAREMTVPVTYVHAPKHNISLARNAGLEEAKASWVAFIDDDEVATSTWISRLYSHAVTHDLDVVFGPAIARYPADTPKWILEYDYLSSYPERRDGEYQTGPTNNVLFNTSAPAIADRRFLLEKGRTGGEDTAFFYDVWHAGGRLGMCESAVVYENADPNRLTFRWLQSRKYRSGMSYGRASMRTENLLNKVKSATLATFKITYCVFCATIFGWSKSRRNFWTLRSIFHFGVMSAFLRPEPELY